MKRGKKMVSTFKIAPLSPKPSGKGSGTARLLFRDRSFEADLFSKNNDA